MFFLHIGHVLHCFEQDEHVKICLHGKKTTFILLFIQILHWWYSLSANSSWHFFLLFLLLFFFLLVSFSVLVSLDDVECDCLDVGRFFLFLFNSKKGLLLVWQRADFRASSTIFSSRVCFLNRFLGDKQRGNNNDCDHKIFKTSFLENKSWSKMLLRQR